MAFLTILSRTGEQVQIAMGNVSFIEEALDALAYLDEEAYELVHRHGRVSLSPVDQGLPDVEGIEDLEEFFGVAGARSPPQTLRTGGYRQG